jgi:protein-L-isoaspartate(D-aspartate) O-methyltransferase
MEEQTPYIHRNMRELCSELISEKWIRTNKVYESMLQVDRGDFAPKRPYQNFPQHIGYNVVISAPLLHAYCLQALEDYLIEGSRVLDIGFGSGYLTVAMSKMMNDKGYVIGVEHIKDLYDFGLFNINKHHKNLIKNKKIELILGDGRLGYKKKAPYKCIHVGAASRKIPDELVEQLDFGGRLVIPLGPPDDQYIYFIDKHLNGKINITKGLSVRYVPLTSAKNQLNNMK